MNRQIYVAYNIVVPKIFGVILTSFVSAMIVDAFNFMLFVVLSIRVVGIIVPLAPILLELAKILDIVHIIGDFASSAGDSDAIICDANLFLFL